MSDGRLPQAVAASGRLLIQLRPSTPWGQSQADVMQRLRQRVAEQVAGVSLYLQPTQDLTIDSVSGPTAQRFDLEGVDTQLVNSCATSPPMLAPPAWPPWCGWTATPPRAWA